MATYENIKLRKRNCVMIDGYFYTIDQDSDCLVAKTDDGTQAFTYPLSTTLSTEVSTLEYDGRNFWSLENGYPSANSLTIRRWYINNYVCELRQTITKTAGANYYDANAFTVEHYHTQFSGDEAAGQTILSVYDGSQASTAPVSYVTFGPNEDGQIEERSVVSATSDSITVTPALSYSYKKDDPVSFYKHIWLFNKYYGTISSGALYKLSAVTGSDISSTSGGQFDGVYAATFYAIPSTVFSTPDDVNCICYIKNSNLIFLNPSDLTSTYGSMALDNVTSKSEVVPIYDLTIEGKNIYRLQKAGVYSGTKETWSLYSYQLSTLDPFVTSIALSATPAILPANNVNTSTIVALVKDQFFRAIENKLVTFTKDGVDGGVSPSEVTTDSSGRATTYYTAGNVARMVTITATAEQG